MAETPKTASTSEMAYAAATHLESQKGAGQVLHGLSEDEAKKLVAKAKQALEDSLGKLSKGSVAPKQDALNTLALEVAEKIKTSPENAATQNAAEFIATKLRDFNAKNVEEVFNASTTAAATAAKKIGLPEQSIKAAARDAQKLAIQPVKDNFTDLAIEKMRATADQLEAYGKKVTEVTKDVPDAKLTEITTATDALAATEMKAAIEARHAHLTKEAALKAAATDGKIDEAGTGVLKGLMETAQKAEEAVANGWKSLLAKFTGKNEAETAKLSMQASVDNSRAANPELHAKWEELANAKVSTKMGEVENMLNTTSLKSVAGVETSVTQKLAAAAAGAAGGWSKMGKYGVAGAGVVVAGLGIKAALSDKPADPNTNERPKMSFMGKVAVTMAIVGGVAASAVALREGNITQGYKDAAQAGKSFLEKLNASRQSALSVGQYSR